MTVEFDESGLRVLSVEEVRQQMIDNATISLAPYLNGDTLQADDSSVIGRLFSLVSVPIVETAEIAPLILQSMSLNDAEGLQLDYLAQTLYNKKRLTSSQASGFVITKAKFGTTIPANSRVSNSRTGDVYYTNSSVTSSNVSCVGVDISVKSISPLYQISYNIDGYLSDSPVITVTPSMTDTTIDMIIDRIINAVNTQSSYLEAVKNKDKTIRVKIKDPTQTGTFSIVSGDLEFTNTYNKNYVTALTYNSQESLPNQITNIGSSISGWLGVTNPVTIEQSSGVETDNNFRKRLFISANSSVNTVDAIKLRLGQLNGVNFSSVATVKEGLSITVQGGNDDEIAYTIFQSVTAGIEMVGNVTKTVRDINGGQHTVRFSRVTPVPLQIQLSLTVYPDFPTGGQIMIKQAIVDYFNNLDVGEDIYLSRLYTPINTIQGFAVNSLQVGRVGGSMSSDNVVVINSNEIATISAENITVG